MGKHLGIWKDLRVLSWPVISRELGPAPWSIREKHMKTIRYTHWNDNQVEKKLHAIVENQTSDTLVSGQKCYSESKVLMRN